MVTQIGVNYYKISESVQEPERATLNSACYDIKAYFHTSTVKAMDTSNNPSEENVMGISNSYIDILPGWRYLIPTGIIFDIPDDYSIRIHPRSGLAWKNGITVANCEGVVDSDYYHETFIMLYNSSADEVRVTHGERIAQGELIKTLDYSLEETIIVPEQKTNRIGGFGSTGTE